MVVLGKAIASGIPLGAYGMTAEVARTLEHRRARPTLRRWPRAARCSPTPCRMTAIRATLEEVLTPDAYEHAAVLGGRSPNGIESVAAARGLNWHAHRLYNRSGYTHAPELPSNALEARATFDLELYNVQRLYMANRAVGGRSTRPAVLRHTDDRGRCRSLLEVLDGFLGEVTRSTANSSSA